ncbi:olfactomedin-like protein 1 [Neolamprologus brichardi]|uniref:olfactomedin-like protein 1 n=1 Tax=Neolamprologus brichardi TaxID=32507 RepID=UPI00164373AE|nr:olfactomedin-like protein 1 [Neolamprologus brichardi]
MSGILPLFLVSLCLIVGSVQSQSSSQDAFIIQYLERRLAQMEEGRVHTTIQGTGEFGREWAGGSDCSTGLSQIKSLKIVKKAGDTYGCWFKDPSEGSAKIYLLSGIRNNTMLEYVSLQSFTERTSSPAKVVQLPFHWQGSGHVVYNGFLYYHKADTTNQIVKIYLLSGIRNNTMLEYVSLQSFTERTSSPAKVVQLPFHWQGSGHVVYNGFLYYHKADTTNQIVKKPLRTLAVESVWDTQCRSHDAEGAFLICGTLYVVYNTRYGGRSTIQCLYDIHDTIHSNESPVMFFPKRYTSHSSIHYHPGDKQLYAWDDGYQTIYKVETRKNDQVIAD